MLRTRCGVVSAGLILALFALAQAPAEPAPVVVGGRTIFTLQTNLGPFSAQDRATAAGQRIARVAEDLTASVDAITVVDDGSTTAISVGDRILVSVTEADAQIAGRTRAQLAADYVQSIRAAVTDLRTQYSSRSLLTGGFFTILITGALIALLMALRRLTAAGTRRIERLKIPSIRIQRVELLSEQRIMRILIHLFRFVRLVLVLAALYLYVPLVLSFFPWTREYAPILVEYIVGPLRSAGRAVLDYLPSLFVVIITSVGAYLLIRASYFLFRELGNGTISWPGFYPEWADPTHKIVRFLILALALVVVFPYLPGSSSPAFQGISIFIGILFSLGSSSAIANIIGGVILTYTRAFNIGDRVKIADTIGDVMEKTLLVTRIRTIKNEFITVPNSMVLGSHIINFSSATPSAPLILHTAVTIGYDAPWRKVHELLIAAAGRTSAILKEPAPFVLQTSLDDFFVTYEINAYTVQATRMAAIYAELHQNIQDCFNEGGVEIMSPHYASLREGNAATTPAEYLPKDYTAPAFQVEPREKAQRPAAGTGL